MGNVEDIPFDPAYSHGTFRFILLHDRQSTGVSPPPVIALPNALLMTFIHAFDRLIRCQQHINTDNAKMITLVISNQQITNWNHNINVRDNNIDKVHIFCEKYSDYLAMKKWDGCYKHKVQEVSLPDTFEYHLLKLGIDYIHKIMPEFRQDKGVYRKFATDAKNLARALENYLQDQIDSLDDD